MKKILFKLTVFAFIAVLFQLQAHALVIDDSFRPINLGGSVDPANNIQDLPERQTVFVLELISGGLIRVAAPVAILLITIAGIRMIISSTDSEQVSAAKKGLMWSIIGLLVIILSYSIVRLVIGILIKV